ncbi:MAG: mannose-6-phosphate isomerase, class I [Anaerolineae bacterium]
MPRPSDVLAPMPYPLQNRIQPYSWGARGSQAYIPQLLGIPAEEGVPYAELWMGSHPSAPSAVCMAGERMPLPDLLTQHRQEVLGARVSSRFGGLPFLFKVLSAAEPLSIQVHPNCAQARALHARDPEHYPDSNHKPEVAVALRRLDVLVGFRGCEELLPLLERYPELAALVSEQARRSLRESAGREPAVQAGALRALVAELLTCARDDLQRLRGAMDALAARLAHGGLCSGEDALLCDLHRRHGGGDLGLPMALLLNRVSLGPGQGLYIAAGVPHAYLCGDIVECMANSDNVVRAGLTNKFVDLLALADVLDCEPGRPAVLEPSPWSAEATYITPAAEFEVRRVRLGTSERRRERSDGGPQVWLLVEGEARVTWAGGAMPWRRGQSLLLPACLPEVQVEAANGCEWYGARVP